MRVSPVEWILMAAELMTGLVIAAAMGWPLWAGWAITFPLDVLCQWLYRRNGDDWQQATWFFECAYTLWRRGGLSARMSVAWANALKAEFGDRWSGLQAAEHQIAKWQN